jgi:catechol 2,3-dioxygenase-like lactoylglutathione lyase family enzyme
MLTIQCVDHIGIRVTDLDRALAFYALLGFGGAQLADGDAVAVIRNDTGVELNIVYNAASGSDDRNILMDVPDKYPGYTHVAFRVASIADAVRMLRDNDITITQGPVSFGRDGHVSVFLRDPDRNIIELRGREEDLTALGGVELYEPKN